MSALELRYAPLVSERLHAPDGGSPCCAVAAAKQSVSAPRVCSLALPGFFQPCREAGRSDPSVELLMRQQRRQLLASAYSRYTFHRLGLCVTQHQFVLNPCLTIASIGDSVPGLPPADHAAKTGVLRRIAVRKTHDTHTHEACMTIIISADITINQPSRSVYQVVTASTAA